MRKNERGLMSAFQKLIRLQPGPKYVNFIGQRRRNLINKRNNKN